VKGILCEKPMALDLAGCDRMIAAAEAAGALLVIGHQRRLQPKFTRARELIEEGAKNALSDLKAVAPYDPGKPCEIEVEFKLTDAARNYGRKPGVEQTGPRTVVSRADDWWSAWQQFFF
jgi:predicted dehydrogenase